MYLLLLNGIMDSFSGIGGLVAIALILFALGGLVVVWEIRQKRKDENEENDSTQHRS